MAGPKRDEAKSILSYVRQELRYMDEDLRNDIDEEHLKSYIPLYCKAKFSSGINNPKFIQS